MKKVLKTQMVLAVLLWLMFFFPKKAFYFGVNKDKDKQHCYKLGW